MDVCSSGFEVVGHRHSSRSTELSGKRRAAFAQPLEEYIAPERIADDE